MKRSSFLAALAATILPFVLEAHALEPTDPILEGEEEETTGIIIADEPAPASSTTTDTSTGVGIVAGAAVGSVSTPTSSNVYERPPPLPLGAAVTGILSGESPK